MDWTLMICAVLGSAGCFSLIQFLIQRRDKKNSTLDEIKKELDELKQDIHRNRALDTRRRILAASDEILHGVKHSQEWWEQTMTDVDDYEKYCDRHKDFKNSKAEFATISLRETYQERKIKKDFLV